MSHPSVDLLSQLQAMQKVVDAMFGRRLLARVSLYPLGAGWFATVISGTTKTDLLAWYGDRAPRKPAGDPGVALLELGKRLMRLSKAWIKDYEGKISDMRRATELAALAVRVV